MPSYEPVTALLRGLQVIEALAARGAQSVGELHSACAIPKATLVRILETLAHAGYVQSGGDGPRYQLTARVLSLAKGFDEARHIVTAVGPLLTKFQTSIPWPSDLGTFDRDAMVILATSRRPGVLSINRAVGSRVSASKTALGRAYLAFIASEQRGEALANLKQLTGEPRDPKRFERLLAEVRKRGYATSDQENEPTIRALAAPIFWGGEVVASLNVIVVAEALTLREIEKRYAEPLLAIARRMSTALGS